MKSLLAFAARHKAWWIAPILLVAAALAAVVLLLGSPAVPFLYGP